MFRRRNTPPVVVDPIELESRVLELRQAILTDYSAGAQRYLATQPGLSGPLNQGLKQLFENTPRENWADNEMEAVGFYLLSIYGD